MPGSTVRRVQEESKGESLQLCEPLALVLLGASADQQTPRKCPRETLGPRAAEASGAPRRPQGDGEAAHTGAEEPYEGPQPATGPWQKIQARKEFNTA